MFTTFRSIWTSVGDFSVYLTPMFATFRSIWTSVGDFSVNLQRSRPFGQSGPVLVTVRSIWASVGDFSVNLDQCWRLFGQSGPVLVTFRSIWTSVGDFPVNYSVNLTLMLVTFRSIWTSVGDFSVNLDNIFGGPETKNSCKLNQLYLTCSCFWFRGHQTPLCFGVLRVKIPTKWVGKTL